MKRLYQKTKSSFTLQLFALEPLILSASNAEPAVVADRSWVGKIGAWPGLSILGSIGIFAVFDLLASPILHLGIVSRVANLCFSLFLRWECQKFFISLSVLPGSLAAMADHLEYNIMLEFTHPN